MVTCVARVEKRQGREWSSPEMLFLSPLLQRGLIFAASKLILICLSVFVFSRRSFHRVSEDRLRAPAKQFVASSKGGLDRVPLSSRQRIFLGACCGLGTVHFNLYIQRHAEKFKEP